MTFSIHKLQLVFLWYLMFFVFLGLSANTNGQRVNDSQLLGQLSTQNRFLKFFQNWNGEVIVRHEAVGKVPMNEFFDNSIIFDELSLSLQKQKKIESLSKRLNKKIEAVLETVSMVERKNHEGEESNHEKLSNKIRQHFLGFIQDVDSELTPAQRSRLRQIQTRFLLRRNGLFDFLGDESVQAMFGLELQKNGIDSRIAKGLSAQLKDQEKRIFDKALDVWLADWTKEQRQIFDREWKKAILSPGGLGQLTWYLAYEKTMEFKDEPQEDLFRFRPNTPVLLHGAEGNVKVLKPFKEKVEFSGLQQLYTLQRAVNSSFVQSSIELVEFQQNEIAKINDEFARYKSTVIASTARQFNISVRGVVEGKYSDGSRKEVVLYDWPEDMGKIDAANEKSLQKKARSCRQEILDVLLPTQLQFLNQVSKRLKIRSLGPMADIEHGELCELLQLSEMQKQSLHRNALKAIDMIEKETRQVWRDSLSELVSALPRHLQGKIRQMIGKPITSGHCDLHNLRIALAR